MMDKSDGRRLKATADTSNVVLVVATGVITARRE